MSKLNVGDIAEFTEDYSACDMKKGDKFTVTRVKECIGEQLVYGFGNSNYGVYSKRLKKVEKQTKKKIKYPIGTIVQLVEKTIVEDGVARGVVYHGPLKVISYTKGSKRPYQVERTEGIHAGYVEKKKLNVRHLRLYEKPVTDEPSKGKVATQTVLDAERRFEQEMVNHLYRMELEARMLMMQQPVTIVKPKEEKKKIMSTIREKIRYAALSSDEKVLRESGILSENGNLTDVGRRVVIDFLFEDKDLRAQVVEAVKTTLPKEK